MAELRVPAELLEFNNWGLWRYQIRDGKKTKVPFRIDGRMASVARPEDWGSFDAAFNAWRKAPRSYTGLGFLFTSADPLAGIDLDDALEFGQVKPWAQRIVERLADTYLEVSPSGKGLKAWVRGVLPKAVSVKVSGGGALEAYDRGRYFAYTGRAFRGAPLQVWNHQSLLDQICEKYRGLAGGPSVGRDQIPKGVQHDTLVQIMGHLSRCASYIAKREGVVVCEEALEECLQIINQRQCAEPGTREAISKIVRSTRGWR